MDCNLLNGGITKGCDNNVGGIRKLWLKEKSAIEDATHGSPIKRISAINMVDAADKFYLFEFGKRSGSNYTQVTTTADTGSTVCVQTITLILARREQAKRDILLLLGKGKELVAIIEDSNGLFWYFGEYEGLEMTENNGGSGAQKTDLNGYTLTFIASEPEEACEVTSAGVEAVIEDAA
jgi:hypothetical protein